MTYCARVESFCDQTHRLRRRRRVDRRQDRLRRRTERDQRVQCPRWSRGEARAESGHRRRAADEPPLPALERRARELGIVELRQGAANKLAETEKLAKKLGFSFAEILYVGDDLPDLAPMSRAGISCAPSDAAAEVLEAARWKLKTRGGHGAFRELVERLLRERGDWESVVQEFLSGRPETQSI